MRALSRPALLLLAAAFGPPLAAAQGPLAVQEFQCRGEEPFWGLAGTRVSAVYSVPGPKGKREVVFRGTLQGVAPQQPTVVVWRGESTHLPKDTLVIVLREEACKSTMADGPALTHRALVSLRGTDALTGCCSVKVGVTPPARSTP